MRLFVREDTIKKTKRQPTEWRIFANHTSDKSATSRLYKELKAQQ